MSANVEHHIRHEYCRTRLKYRQGKQLTAVKVYTVANESVNLLVFGVPKIKLQEEVKNAFQRYGKLLASKCITEEISQSIELERFTDVYHIKFLKLEHARRAKKFLDAREFFGGILHVTYAPEYETIEELRSKLEQRQREINFRTRLNARIEQAKVSTNEKTEDIQNDKEFILK